MTGSLEQDGVACEWDLSWEPRLPAYGHVHPFLRRAKIAKTVLFLPHPDVDVRGFVRIGERRIDVAGAGGGQAHLWGSKHATRWAWAHCNDFTGPDGRRARRHVHRRRERVRAALRPRDRPEHAGRRAGRRAGPAVDRAARRDAQPERVRPRPLALRGARRRAARRPARCRRGARTWSASPITTPTASWPIATTRRWPTCGSTCGSATAAARPWRKVDELRSERHAHFEYAQRTPVDGVPLLVR